jgi:hypothetical protein
MFIVKFTGLHEAGLDAKNENSLPQKHWSEVNDCYMFPEHHDLIKVTGTEKMQTAGAVITVPILVHDGANACCTLEAIWL